MISKNSVAAIVIVFNPSEVVVHNILSYVSGVDKLFIYDNSSYSNEELFSTIITNINVEYFFNGINEGIAVPLNIIANKCISEGYSWLLTMDQDSTFGDYFTLGIPDEINNNLDLVGVISPRHITCSNYGGFNSELSIGEGVSYAETVMTSGNLINLNAFKTVGGFEERFFIDCVDWDFCIKMSLNHFLIVINNSLPLMHELGEPIVGINPITKREKIVYNHGFKRRYYITRNKLLLCEKFMLKKTKLSLYFLFGLMYTDICNIILYESDKKMKLRCYGKGVIDYIRRRWGEASF